MSVEFNHTIVHVRDKEQSATFYTGVLGLAAAASFGPFAVIQFANGASLDLITDADSIKSQHYAFMVSESEFDDILERIQYRRLPYWADPSRHKLGEINHNDGGRGVYWQDQDGHLLEVLTRNYGSG